MNRLKTEEPDRYQQLKDGLRFRRKRSKKIRQDQSTTGTADKQD
jgi:hypothetical protein